MGAPHGPEPLTIHLCGQGAQRVIIVVANGLHAPFVVEGTPRSLGLWESLHVQPLAAPVGGWQ